MSRDDEIFKKIFDWQWLVSMPQMWVYSQWQYEQFGIAISGDQELDDAIMRQYVTVMRSIADLAELHDEGKPFIIKNTKDTKAIFDIIVEYLNYASTQLYNQVTSSLRSQAEPNEKFVEVCNDLVKLQNLGNRIFPVMVSNVELKPESKGLMGWIDRHNQRYGIKSFDFNPISRYNIDMSDFVKDYDQENRNYNAINLKSAWNTNLGNQMGGYL